MTKIENRYNEVLEAKVENLLQFFAKDNYSKYKIAPHIAKASLNMNHLYKDLGFKNRMQMGKYMKQHFPKLSKMKPQDTLWKKYIYDLILEVAPACAKCNDQEKCFSCKE